MRERDLKTVTTVTKNTWELFDLLFFFFLQGTAMRTSSGKFINKGYLHTMSTVKEVLLLCIVSKSTAP